MDNRFIIIVAGRNNAQWANDNVNSILAQDYANYKVIFFDDASTDGTDKIVQEKVKNDSRWIVYPSMKRQWKTWFFSRIDKVFPLLDNDILVFLDGDDLFYCENVLSYLNAIYNQTQCWMTYGGMTVWTGGENYTEPYPQNSEIPPQVSETRSFRKDTWRTSHLKSMRGFLWKRFDKKDLLPDEIPMVGPDDLAIMFAALEMTPTHKVHRITEAVYAYNHSPENQQSRAYTEHKFTGIDYESRVRNRTPYDRISVVSPILAGGLGNQLFEVAAVASHAKDFEHLLVINPTEHILPNQGRNITNYVDNVFSRIALDSKPPVEALYQWDKPTYSKIPNGTNAKLGGHFQSYKYFDHNREYIRDLFAPTYSIRERIMNDYGSLLTDVTAIQVRRGDYWKFPDHHPLLTPEYYAKAVKMAAPKEIWIFSDDIEWCRQHLHFECPVRYIKEDDYIELYMMSFCKNLIISNSSFGWWAAYLNRRPDAKVFVPARWFGPALIKEGFDIEHLIPDGWTFVI